MDTLKKYLINKVPNEKGVLYVQDDIERMNAQIEEVGRDGMLHFIITTNKDGWLAQCEEISGIITGGKNSNPTQEEINLNIRDAVYSTFNVKPVSKVHVSRGLKTTLSDVVDMTKIRIQSTISI